MIDVITIGGGPAGATAALYTARAGFETKIIYKDSGALGKAERVENFYGHVSIGGEELFNIGLNQAISVGAEVTKSEVVSLKQGDGLSIIVETTDNLYTAKTVLLATGAGRATPKIDGILEYEGSGISYCAICDGFFYKGKDVAVIGNGKYALHEVEDLLPLVSSVTLLTDGKDLEADFPGNVLVRKEKINEIFGEEVSFSIPGLPPKKSLKGVKLNDGEDVLVSGLFVAVGIAGGIELARKLGATLSEDVKTSIENLWVAGDCKSGLKQIAKAAHDGAEAGMDIVRFLRKK